MRTHKTPPIQGLFLLFLLPLALLTLPNPAWAHHEQVAQASGSLETAEAPKAEGSKSKGTGHGSPQGMMGGPHGKSEGSGSKRDYGKGYGHGSKHGYGKMEGSRSKHRYSKHGYSRHGYGGHGYRGGHGKDPFHHVLRFAKSLGLTADQIGKIKNMKFEFAKMRIMLKAHHQVAHMELEQLVHSGEVKESEMREVADRIIQIKSKKIHSMVEAKIGLLKLLTPEQRKKMSQVHSKH